MVHPGMPTMTSWEAPNSLSKSKSIGPSYPVPAIIALLHIKLAIGTKNLDFWASRSNIHIWHEYAPK